MVKFEDCLKVCTKQIYEPAGLFFTLQPTKEIEGTEYGAYSFELNNRRIRFRVAKITPTKNGQFVTLWKRPESGRTTPFDVVDPVDLFMICAWDGDHFGLFIFSKEVLVSKGIVSKGGTGGKLAIRVYPPWVKTESKQAATTQQWQAKYFIYLSQGIVDVERVRVLFGFFD